MCLLESLFKQFENLSIIFKIYVGCIIMNKNFKKVSPRICMVDHLKYGNTK